MPIIYDAEKSRIIDTDTGESFRAKSDHWQNPYLHCTNYAADGSALFAAEVECKAADAGARWVHFPGDDGMAEFVKATDDALVALPWQVVIRCADLNMELGGVMIIKVVYDPQLTHDNMIYEIDLSQFANPNINPELLNGIRGRKTRHVFSSPESKKIMELSFASSRDNRTMVWHLISNSNNVISTSRTIPETVNQPQLSAEEFLVEALTSLGKLKCWSDLNADRYTDYIITIDRDLAEALPDIPRAGYYSDSQVVLHAGKVG